MKLYVVAALLFASLLAAVAVPNVLEALDRKAEKRSMADMRTIATAWEGRATDTNSYLVQRPGPVSYEELRRVLEPTYVKHLPRENGWGDRFVMESSSQEYSIRSMGADHHLDRKLVPGAITNFDCDVVYSNGTFVAYIEGTCQE